MRWPSQTLRQRNALECQHLTQRRSSIRHARANTRQRAASHILVFTFQGSDEGIEVSGDSDADLAEDSLNGEVRFHNGDDMPFIAKRW